jgi:tetratricopeptide (TPR) repeat protein
MPPSRLLTLAAALSPCLLVAAPSTAAAPQPQWTWPQRAQRLEVLAADFPPERLRAVMLGFTRSLGVRCQHCHVGEEGEPLSSFDFVSDQNPNKGRAREMLRMLGSINQHLAKIEPSGAERVNMWCHTCHQGRPRPQTLEEALLEAYREGKAPAAVARYRELRASYHGTGGYDFGERSLADLGERLLGDGDGAGAIALLRLNLEQFPGSGDAYAGLAEAYLAAGRRDLAGVFLRKALELDPEDAQAARKLRELEAAPAEAPGAEAPGAPPDR